MDRDPDAKPSIHVPGYVIKSDLRWREFKVDCPKKIRASDFDWLDPEPSFGFFRFQDTWHHLAEFEALHAPSLLTDAGWDGAMGWSYSNGALIKLHPDGEQYIVAYFYTVDIDRGGLVNDYGHIYDFAWAQEGDPAVFDGDRCIEALVRTAPFEDVTRVEDMEDVNALLDDGVLDHGGYELANAIPLNGSDRGFVVITQRNEVLRGAVAKAHVRSLVTGGAV